jgi:hypothetical protein
LVPYEGRRSLCRISLSPEAGVERASLSAESAMAF